MPDKKIIISVINDLSNDQRVHRICTSLQNSGYNVILTGRKLPNSPKINREYEIKRFKLLINKGMLFYACFNIRLFWFYIFNKYDILVSNDLDTLSAAGFVNIFKRKTLIYDSHELFTEVPELQNKNLKKRFWLLIEKLFIRKAFKSYTVCKPIADYYNKKYNINMQVIRNLPLAYPFPYDYNSRDNILLYQGSLNKERGLEMLVEAMQYIPNYKLIIAGKGDIFADLKLLTTNLKLNNKVKFTGNLDFNKLQQLTKTAKIGFSLEQGSSLSYKYSLPNKIFDYIQGGVPVICSDLPEMSKIIKDYKVGQSVECKTGKELAKIVNELISTPNLLSDFHKNCKEAARKLCWNKEEIKLKNIFE